MGVFLTPERTMERAEGPTPRGAAYSIAYYRDKDGALVPKKLAEKITIHEFDENDEVVRITQMVRKGTTTV